jgi:2-dehydro-3-deoxyphosphooctonate aldolase (KDO 8-P synthase)
MWDTFGLIAGPCLLEDDALNLRVAECLARVGSDHGIPVVFKASFDKANRSKGDSLRGPGLETGLKRLRRVKEATGLMLLTDIHEPAQAGPASEVVDVLQIPAFLSRQTDLLRAAGATGLPVNVKRGQWMAPEDLSGAVTKLRDGGASEVLVTERGTFFGYGDLVVDMRVFPRVRAACGVPVVFDGTHSVQRPGRADGNSGGDPEYTPTLVRAAVAAGCDGLFLEVHPDPSSAPSDGRNMLELDKLSELIGSVMRLRAALESTGAAL